MYGRIIGATGWRLPEIDALSCDDVTELFREWNEDPPMAEIVKAWVGFERREPEEAPTTMREVTLAEWERMKASMQSGISELNARSASAR